MGEGLKRYSPRHPPLWGVADLTSDYCQILETGESLSLGKYSLVSPVHSNGESYTQANRWPWLSTLGHKTKQKYEYEKGTSMEHRGKM